MNGPPRFWEWVLVQDSLSTSRASGRLSFFVAAGLLESLVVQLRIPPWFEAYSRIKPKDAVSRDLIRGGGGNAESLW